MKKISLRTGAVIIRMIRDAGMEAISYQDQYVLLEHVDRLWFDREASVCRMEYKEVPDLAAYVTFPVVKLMACGAPEQILALEKQAREAIGSRWMFSGRRIFIWNLWQRA